MTNIETILDRATEVLGTRDRADDWVDKQSTTLGNSPRVLSETDEGTKSVLLHLMAISQHSHQ